MKTTMPYNFFYSFLIFLFLSFPVASQDAVPKHVQPDLMPEPSILPDVKIETKTHPEKVVFTQIKLANGTLDADAFAKASPHVQEAQPIDKLAVTLNEYNRISNAYSLHDQKADIVVHSAISVDQYSSLQDFIVFDEFEDSTFFNFNMYDYHVAIVPEDIQRLSRIALSKSRAEKFFEGTQTTKNILAEFILTPVYSDVKTPLQYKEKDLWLMYAKIGEVRFWSGNSDLLWYYRAPWHKTKTNENIDDLYSEPVTQ